MVCVGTFQDNATFGPDGEACGGVVPVSSLPVSLPAAPTVIEKAGNEAEALPSLTVITMFANVACAFGVPVSAPVAVLNCAQAGLFWIVNASVSPSASAALGVREYAAPRLASLAALPEIVG